MPRRLPDADVTKTICAYVRAGTFQWVAAVAAGISKGKFAEWMKGPTIEEQEFQYAVNQATAQCRVVAESNVATRDSFKWLMYGPGRERVGEPGWSKQTALVGADGGPVTAVVPQATEDYSKLTVDELKTLRDLRDRVRVAAPAPTEPPDETV